MGYKKIKKEISLDIRNLFHKIILGVNKLSHTPLPLSSTDAFSIANLCTKFDCLRHLEVLSTTHFDFIRKSSNLANLFPVEI